MHVSRFLQEYFARLHPGVFPNLSPEFFLGFPGFFSGFMRVVPEISTRVPPRISARGFCRNIWEISQWCYYKDFLISHPTVSPDFFAKMLQKGFQGFLLEFLKSSKYLPSRFFSELSHFFSGFLESFSCYLSKSLWKFSRDSTRIPSDSGIFSQRIL